MTRNPFFCLTSLKKDEALLHEQYVQSSRVDPSNSTPSTATPPEAKAFRHSYSRNSTHTTAPTQMVGNQSNNTSSNRTWIKSSHRTTASLEATLSDSTQDNNIPGKNAPLEHLK